jgi:hypothetical protein
MFMRMILLMVIASMIVRWVSMEWNPSDPTLEVTFETYNNYGVHIYSHTK